MKNSKTHTEKKQFTSAERKLLHTLRDYHEKYGTQSDVPNLTYNMFIGGVIEYYLMLLNNGNDYGQYTTDSTETYRF